MAVILRETDMHTQTKRRAFKTKQRTLGTITISKEFKLHENRSRRFIVTAKKTHERAAILKREENENPYIGIYVATPYAFAPSTFIPNVITIGNSV